MKTVRKAKEILSVCVGLGLFAGCVIASSAQSMSDQSGSSAGSADRLIGESDQSGQSSGQSSGVVITERESSQSGGADLQASQQGVPLQDAEPILRASKFLDKNVQNQSGQKLGEVEEIMLSADRQRVEHVKVSVDGGEQVTVQLKDIMAGPSSDENAVIVSSLPTSASQGLDASPSAADPALDQASRDAQGQAYQNDAEANNDQRKASKLIGMNVKDNSGEDVGSINDLLINSESGEIENAAISIGGIMGIGSKLASVEWSTVQFLGDDVTLGLSKSELSGISHSEQDYWDRHISEQKRDQSGIQRENQLKDQQKQDRKIDPLTGASIN